MLIQFLFALAALLAVGIIVIGARFLLRPDRAAADFGIRDPMSPACRPWLQAKGVRDIGSGLVGLVLIVWGEPNALGLFLVGASVIPIGDAAIVLQNGGTRASALGIHGVTAALMIFIGISLFQV